MMIVLFQGDADADTFYILFEGEALATKAYGSNTPVEVMRYSKGDYFGELALINHIPRSGM
jgi:CRP-like cAMP-binding protein